MGIENGSVFTNVTLEVFDTSNVYLAGCKRFVTPNQ